ncbi:MAG: extracellular solute-binding protein [Clostridia bacterium]|nr:extracellular solute-binding protein [Clostridia bacterium]
MKHPKITRAIALILAALCLVSSLAVSVSADVVGDNITNQSSAEYRETMSTISYAEYKEQYAADFSGKESGKAETLTFDATTRWVFRDGKHAASSNVISIENGNWTLTTPKGVVYTSVEAAVAAGFKRQDLVYVTDEYDGVPALYTPSNGYVTWSLDFAALGLSDASLYQITIDYYPILGKAAAIEREFSIVRTLADGSIEEQAPFSEARALTMPKLWTSGAADKAAGLTAIYMPQKGESVQTILGEAASAGVKAEIAADGDSICFFQPEVTTEKNLAFLEKYGLRFFTNDADHNEIRPTMRQTPAWTSYILHDSDGYYVDSFGFVLEPEADGTVRMMLRSVNEPMAISKIVLTPYESVRDYADYLSATTAVVGNTEGKDVIKLEAEYPTTSSTNVVYPVEDRTSAVTSPVDTTRTVLNTIGGTKWETSGQWVEYDFSVETSGWYDIFSRFRQSYLDGMYVSRSLRVFTNYESEEAYKKAVGNTAGYYSGFPFYEAALLRYGHDNKWQVTDLSAGIDADNNGSYDSYKLYFERGVVYSLRLEVTLGTMSNQIRNIQSILTSLNNDYLSIIKLTGTSPDDYQDYSFTRRLPETLIDMGRQADALDLVSEFLKTNGGVASTYSGTCDKLSKLLRRMVKDESNIAKNLDTFKSYIGSLGTFLTDAKTQPLQLDYMMIQPASVEAPQANCNFFKTFWHEVKCFFQSFVRDYNSMGAMEDAENSTSIDVWLAYGRDQSQVIRNLCTNEFTPATGTAVNLKLVAGSTLLPSILAGMGPDVYLGLGQATVINYAIRGALRNVEEMEGFEDATKEFNSAAMLVLGTADVDGEMHYYGLPENQDFPMMFVRLDILANLGIEIPRTWEEVYIAQSTLESNNMSIGVPTNYTMHLYQKGGNLFADEGMRINLDSVEGLTAFNTMCNMFTQYSFPYSYSAANRFRTGEMPIIISDYTALYNHLKVFATEIDGSWTFVPLPGYEIEDENGNKIIDEDGNTRVNNASIATILATVMINGSENEEAAWRFIKWYTGADCQTEYANEMVAIIGDSAKHPTANRTALAQMPWTRAEYAEVQKQFENLAAVPNYPGYYILGRYTEFAFLAAYNNDADPSTELLSYINTINNEISRKRTEFGLETLEIGQTLAEKRMAQAEKAMTMMKNPSQEIQVVIEAARYAIANRKIVQLRETSERFAAFLINSGDIDYVKADGSTMKVPSYYLNVRKQTSDSKNGGYRIEDLTEQQLYYFISTCLANAADALASY